MEIVRRRDRKVRKVWVGGEGSYTHTYVCYLSSVSISIIKGLNSNVEQKKKKKRLTKGVSVTVPVVTRYTNVIVTSNI